jgi:antitoxin component YwqK of YwqJK toxin-antitoxin module
LLEEQKTALIMKRIYTILAFLIPVIGFSTTDIEFPIALFGDIEREGVDPEGYPNETDSEGLKQGMWTIWGRMKPEKGYPEDGRIEEGPYKDDRKNGEWIKYHKDGKTPRLIGVYVNNRPNGAYKKYYEHGGVMEEGTFSAGKQKEVYKRYHENGNVAQEKTFNDNGKEDGKVAFYFEDGTPEFVFNKKDGVTVGTGTRYYPNGDVREVIDYNNDGSVAAKTPKERVNPPKGETPAANNGSGGPSGDEFNTKNGEKFNRDGYNKLYNKADELEMDGDFKKGKLWNGKLYKYDSDGILLKIEIWKKGKYHSDGQL